MNNNIITLRDALFATLAGLQSKTKPLDIERARAINETGQVIINSVKAESDYLKATGGSAGSGFIAAPVDASVTGSPALNSLAQAGTTKTGTGIKTVALVPGGSITKHTLR